MDTLKKQAADSAEQNEEPFKGEELLSEIKPLLDDYFVGNFIFDGKAIICEFLNGQKFSITAEEIK